jgi:hypothetical protein
MAPDDPPQWRIEKRIMTASAPTGRNKPGNGHEKGRKARPSGPALRDGINRKRS